MSGVGFVIFVLWIAVSNLVLGFALAIAMGHGPRRMPRLGLALLLRWRMPSLRWRLPLLNRSNSAEPAESSAPAESPPQGTSSPTVAAGEPTAATDDGVPLAEALAQFQSEVADVRSGFEDVKQRVQACAESPTAEVIEDCVADLKNVGQQILDQRANAIECLQDSSDGSAAQQQAIDEVQQASARQAADIQETLEEITQLELNPESLEQDCQQLQDHTETLVACCDGVSESIETAKSQVEAEAATSHANRSGAEPQLERVEASAALDEWWADDPEHERPLTMVMIDLDGVAGLNEAYGKPEVDSLLTRVEELVGAADIHGGRATQINAQRFLLLLPKVEMQKLTREIEQLREQIAALSVSCEKGELQVTASCAIAFSRAGDSARALVARAESALLEAKQFGGNRTFTNQGDFPTPAAVTALQEEAVAV